MLVAAVTRKSPLSWDALEPLMVTRSPTAKPLSLMLIVAVEVPVVAFALEILAPLVLVGVYQR